LNDTETIDPQVSLAKLFRQLDGVADHFGERVCLDAVKEVFLLKLAQVAHLQLERDLVVRYCWPDVAEGYIARSAGTRNYAAVLYVDDPRWDLMGLAVLVWRRWAIWVEVVAVADPAEDFQTI